MGDRLTYYSTEEILRELKSRGHEFYYDNVDYALWMDISSVFESLSCPDRKKLRDLVVKFKNR